MPSGVITPESTRTALGSALLTVTTMAATLIASSVTSPRVTAAKRTVEVGGLATNVVRPISTANGTPRETTSGGQRAFTGAPGSVSTLPAPRA